MRAVAVPLTIGLLLAACGDDDSGGGDQQAFCDLIASSSSGPDLESDEGIAAFRELAEVAPGEIRDDVEVLLGAVEQLESIDENDPDAFEQFFAIALDPSFVSATENLEAYAVDECGLDPGVFDDGEDTELGDVDLSDVGGSSDGLDVDGIQAFVSENHASEEWADEINGWIVFGREVEIQGDGLEDDAVVACEAVLGYITGIDPEATLTVSNFSGEPFVTGTLAGGCVEV